MKYLIDSNIFIESKNSFYAFDICPGFWNWLKSSESLRSIERVKEELNAGEDELKTWVNSNLPNSFFLREDRSIQELYSEIASYVMALPKDYKLPGKLNFLAGADGWLIAAARSLNYTIITHEKYDASRRNKILIPNIAEHYQVRCIDIFSALREMKVQFN